MSIVIKSVLVFLLLCVGFSSSYRLFNVQNDGEDYQLEIEKPNETLDDILITTDELEMEQPSEELILRTIKQKIEALEDKIRQQESTIKQNILTNKINDQKRRKVAKIQLETKYKEPERNDDSMSFWNWLVGISKYVISGVLNFFGVRY